MEDILQKTSFCFWYQTSHYRCAVSLAWEIYWIDVILINNGRMKNNEVGITCQGRDWEASSCSKWNGLVNRKTHLAQTTSFIHTSQHLLTTLASSSLLYRCQNMNEEDARYQEVTTWWIKPPGFGHPYCPRSRNETQASCALLHSFHPQVTALVAAQNSAEFNETNSIIKLNLCPGNQKAICQRFGKKKNPFLSLERVT